MTTPEESYLGCGLHYQVPLHSLRVDRNKPGAFVAVLESETSDDGKDFAVVLDVRLHDTHVEDNSEVMLMWENTGGTVGQNLVVRSSQ